MKPNHERPATELMRNYWAACRARGEKPRRVFGLVALKGAEQPAGYVLHWGLLRSYVESLQERRGDADKWEILEFEPCD